MFTQQDSDSQQDQFGIYDVLALNNTMATRQLIGGMTSSEPSGGGHTFVQAYSNGPRNTVVVAVGSGNQAEGEILDDAAMVEAIIARTAMFRATENRPNPDLVLLVDNVSSVMAMSIADRTNRRVIYANAPLNFER